LLWHWRCRIFQDLKKKKNGEGEWYGGDEKERISPSINQSLWEFCIMADDDDAKGLCRRCSKIPSEARSG
jgi:hypothetical protein